MKYIAFILTALLFSSCETIVDDVDLSQFSEIREKLVVNSFISPQDETIFVKVTKSIPINKTKEGQYIKGFDDNGDSILVFVTPNTVKDAVVKISGEGKTINFYYNSTTEYYETFANDLVNFKIQNGKTYTLTVTTKDLRAEATTTIPVEDPEIKNPKYKKVFRSFFGSPPSPGYEATFEWEDPKNSKNYYKIWGELTYLQEVPKYDAKTKEIIYETKNLFSYFNWSGDDFRRRRNYYSDKQFDGTVFKSPLGEILKFERSQITFNNIKYFNKPIEGSKDKLRLQLSNISKEFYDYQVSLQDFFESSNNPFAEPIPVYSNIKGGLGCFAGFTRQEVVLELE
jgi:Domain of unknown function (DUF4249)